MIFYSIIYPGYIQLPFGEVVDFDFESQQVKFIIASHMKPLIVFDTFNELQSNGFKFNRDYTLNNQPGGLIYSKSGDESDTYSNKLVFERLPITASRVFYNIKCSNLYFILPNGDNTPDFDFAERLIGHFIQIYRRSSNDVFVSDFTQLEAPYAAIQSGTYKVTPEGKYEFSHDSIKALWGKFITNQSALKTDSIKELERIRNALKNKGNLEFKDIFIKALEEIHIKKNFKYALLEVFIFVEQIIVKALKSIKLSKGISKTTIKDFEKEVGIGYFLNIEIPLVLDSYKENQTLFQNIDKVRKKRNNVVHRGETVSESEAKFALENSYNLFRLLSNYITT